MNKKIGCVKMGVPAIKEFYLPALKFFEDQKIHMKKDVAEYAADYLNLSDDDLKEKTSGGKRLKYKLRSIFAVDHLYNATLLERVNKGEYKISKEGLKVLNENWDSIDKDVLMRYDSFREYMNKYKNKQSGNAENKNVLSYENIVEIRILPMSNKDPCCSNIDKAIDFMSNRIITENNCHYYFKKKFNFIGNTLILFQYEGGLIASAVFTECKVEKYADYEGYFVIDKDSIRIFDKKITIEELNEFVTVSGFSQVKRIIELKNLNKIYEMINYYSSDKIVKQITFNSVEKRNIIYFGAPGTGKSFNLNKDKKLLLKDHDDNYERVTFHPDYSYANFVGTYKPVPKGDDISYEYVPGPFMRILKKAINKPSEPFLLIIEEINRANVAAVFGDVFQLLDRDENYESVYPIDLSQEAKSYINKDKIKLPSNLFIWATMNSADQGVFPMDTAFKRRWDFKYFSINNNEDLIEDTHVILNDKKLMWNDLRKQINDELLSYKINEDKCLGPFFAFNEFMNKEIPTETFKDIFKSKIIMYLFEDAARSKRNDMFAGAKGDDKYVTYSKICEVFDNNGIGIFCDNIRNEFASDDEE